jgi:hypothetical protein
MRRASVLPGRSGHNRADHPPCITGDALFTFESGWDLTHRIGRCACTTGRGKLSEEHGQMLRKPESGHQIRARKVKSRGAGDQKGTTVNAELV